MTPNAPSTSDQTTTQRRRPTSDRVVPAIPLALSKPRPSTKSKPKPRPEANEELVEKHVTHGVAKAEPTVGAETSEVFTNGEVQASAGAEAPSELKLSSNGVKGPAADTPRSNGSAAMSLSNGATPELQTTASTLPSTPPPVQDTLPTASPLSARKPMDRFDIRQIRTELPPAFIPSAEQHTPRSAASSHSNRPQFLPHAHPSHPSAGSIVFGGPDSSNTSPAPPLSGGSAFVPPPFSGFGHPHPPYFVPQGHAHHASEPHGHRMYQSSYQQPPALHHSRQQFAQPAPNGPYYHPHAHMPFRYPPREVFTPAEPHQPNGISSRSGSQTSSSGPEHRQPTQSLPTPLSPEEYPELPKPGAPEPKTVLPQHAHPRPQPMNHTLPQRQRPPPPPAFPPPDFNVDLENAEALRAYVLSQFSDPELSDCVLEITEGSSESEQQFKGHQIVLGRSAVLFKLLQTARSTKPGSDNTNVSIRLTGQYNRAHTFVDALKYLYGGPLLQMDHHRPMSAQGEHFPSNTDRMENALQYIATGSWLKVPAIASRGVEVATNLLHWDTISSALAFALDGGLSPIWAVEDGSEDRVSTSSSDDLQGKLESISIPSFDPYSTHFLQRILDFTVHMFPPNFYLDAAAPQVAACARLPLLPQGHESRPSRSDPRLTQIRFGEIPVDDHQRPSFATSTISGVLLSLPFVLLKCVLEHFDLAARLGSDTVASIMRQVIAEREMRRTKTLKALAAGQLGGTRDDATIQNLFWEESVEPSAQHRAGFRLVRRKREIDTPPSSGACSERSK